MTQVATGEDVEEQPVNNEEVTETAEEDFDEFEESKERHDRHMPIIYSYADRQTQAEYAKRLEINIEPRPTIGRLIKTREFTIYDMHVSDSENSSIIGSFALYYIEPYKQIVPMDIASIPGIKVKKNIWYEILEGKGLLCIGDYTEPVIQRDLLLLEQDVRHNFFNTGKSHLVIKMIYDGYLDLRDRYTPTKKISQEAQESKEKFFNAATQQEEERVVKTVAQPQSQEKKRVQVPVPAVKRLEVTGQSVTTMSPDAVRAPKPKPKHKSSEDRFV